jgi:hypothetical protein
MAGPTVSLHDSFSEDLRDLAGSMRAWSGEAAKAALQAHKEIGERHRSEAVKRVPVDTGTLKQKILTNTYESSGVITTETGTNIEGYPVFVEFGTRFIAKGRVLALGTRPDVTDAEAPRNWPAKNDSIVDRRTGEANQTVVAAIQKRWERGGRDEQMPWLRPSWMFIRQWAIAAIEAAFKPPKGKGGKGRRAG